MGLLDGLPADSLVDTEEKWLCQFWRNIGHRPDLVNGKSILAICVHNLVSRNCAIAVLTVKPHIITSTELYRQGIAPRSQYSDLMPEAAMLH